MKFWQRKKDSGQVGTTEITSDEIDTSGKTVICLPGMFVTNDASEAYDPEMWGLMSEFADRIEEAGRFTLTNGAFGFLEKKMNGFTRIAEQLLGGDGVYEQGIKIYAVSLNKTQEALIGMTMANEYPRSYYSDEAMDFAIATFGKVLGDIQKVEQGTEGKYTITGNRHEDVEGVRDNLSNITLFGQSRGTSFAREIENALADVMKSTGYDDVEERRELVGQIHLLGTGSISRAVDVDGSRFSTVFIEGTNDKVAEVLNRFKSPTPEGHDQMSIYRMPGSGILVVADIPLKIEYAKRREDGSEEVITLEEGKTAHHITFHTQKGIGEDQFSVAPYASERVLRSMVNRASGEKRDLLEMLRTKPEIVIVEGGIVTDPNEGRYLELLLDAEQRIVDRTSTSAPSNRVQDGRSDGSHEIPNQPDVGLS
jgi:hypothetical protein